MSALALRADGDSRGLPTRKRQQGDVARLLDGIGQAALMRRAYAGQAARHDLAGFRYKLRKQPHILVVDTVDLLDAELANLLAPEEFPSAFARPSRASAGTASGTRTTGPIRTRAAAFRARRWRITGRSLLALLSLFRLP